MHRQVLLYLCLFCATATSQSCPNTRITPHSSGGEIYHSQYSFNKQRVNCSLSYVAQRNQVVLLYFFYVNVHAGRRRCSGDVLTVHDGPNADSRVIATFCNRTQRRPASMLTSGQSATLRLSVDGTSGDRDFSLLYFFVDRDTTCESATYLSADKGLIVSHPAAGRKDYGNLLNCKWIISGRSGTTVRLVFDTFALEESPRCAYDSLTILDGGDESRAVIRRLCGKEKPGSVRSSGRQLTLRFTSDGLLTGLGFRIRYSIVGNSRPNEEVPVGYEPVDRRPPPRPVRDRVTASPSAGRQQATVRNAETADQPIASSPVTSV